MGTVPIYNAAKEKIGSMDLPAAVFEADLQPSLFYEVVKAQQASQRAGTHKTKEKGEVRGGGRKPFRQKGTGRARQGSIRSPLWVGGGTIFGPKPRHYGYRVHTQMRKKALCSALSWVVKEDALFIINNLELAEIKTKKVKAVLDKFGVAKGLIIDQKNQNLQLSLRNLSKVKYMRPEGLNIYDVLKFEKILMTEKAVRTLISRLTP